MNTRRANNPATICAMVFAVVTALGVAGWSISNAMAPPPRPQQTTPAPKAAKKLQAAPKVAVKEAQPTIEQSATAKPIAAGAAGEALAAPEADPFAQIHVSEAPAPAVATAVAAQPPVLPSVGLQGGPGLMAARPVSVDIRPVVETKAPELVGTMLGNQPSAVFRDNQRIAVVPEGQRFGDWMVVMVDHGRAVVTNGPRTLRLQVTSLRMGSSGRQEVRIGAFTDSSQPAHENFAAASTGRAIEHDLGAGEEDGDLRSAFVDAAHLGFLEAAASGGGSSERLPAGNEPPSTQTPVPSRQSDPQDPSPAEKPRNLTGAPPPSRKQ